MNIRTRRLALLVPAVAALLGMTGEPTSVVPAPREDAGAIARQDQLVSMVRDAKAPVPVLFVGDSITQAWNDPGKATWDAMIAPLGAMNLGNSGDRTENVLWRLQQAPLTKLSPRAIVLLIGTNDIEEGADAATVKARYKLLVKQLHPDANGGDRSLEDRLREIIDAYTVLRAARLV
jgi:lysophospholipase L1-like esterase